MTSHSVVLLLSLSCFSRSWTILELSCFSGTQMVILLLQKLDFFRRRILRCPASPEAGPFLSCPASPEPRLINRHPECCFRKSSTTQRLSCFSRSWISSEEGFSYFNKARPSLNLSFQHNLSQN